MNEVEITLLLCAWLAGADVEASHSFDNLGGTRRIRTDCETSELVIEVGLDGTSGSRDSVHQALFASALTGKVPMVVMIDRDGVEGRYEQEMRLVAARAGVPYARCSKDFIVRWRMTQPFRSGAALGDLPPETQSWGVCNISEVVKAAVTFGAPGCAETVPQDWDKALPVRAVATGD